jgi:pyruvate dehydrogenase E2 component (dihydrolipoamide acetyltransferase)
MSTLDIIVPDLGDFEDVEVIEVLVAAGDTVAAEDGLITLETDKASMDVPAPAAGAVVEISVAVGDKVSAGSVIGKLTIADEQAPDVAAPAAQEIIQGETTVVADLGVAAPGSGGMQTVSVPDIGDFSDVDVIEVHVSKGDVVALEDPLVTLETDKAAMDVPATVAGTVDAMLVKAGDTVSQGSPIAVIDAIASAATAPAPQKTPPVAAPSPTAVQQTLQPQSPPHATATGTSGSLPAIDEAGFSRAHASPSVRKLARELGVNLIDVKGSGLKSRILHEDVKAYVKAILTSGGPAGAALPQVPVVDFAKFGDIDSKPLTRIQKISGPRLQASWINLPHVTQHDLADITELEAKRQELKGPAKAKDIGLTPLAFILKAVIATLKEYPKANASLSGDGQSLVYKHYYHLGFAADTENGLMVPVIRDADKMDVYELATQLGELSLAAREGKLKADQLQGASFTVSSLGGIGGTAFTPIVNAPEVAILGVSRSSMQPVWDGSEFAPRLMLPLSLSYDHRVIDGAYAVRFTTYLGQVLADVEKLLQAIP